MDGQGHEESKMENNFSHPENSVINLKQLPPIDPSTIVNSSFNGKSRQSGAGSAHKNVKPNFNRGLKSFKSVQALRKSNSGSISSGKTSETPWNTTSDSNSADNGIELAFELLFSICFCSLCIHPSSSFGLFIYLFIWSISSSISSGRRKSKISLKFCYYSFENIKRGPYSAQIPHNKTL